MMTVFKPAWFSALGLCSLLLLAGCSQGTAGITDVYADPTGAVPAPFTATEMTATFSTSVSATPDSDGLLTLTVPGFVDATGKAVKNLSKSNFTVIEDGKLKGFTAASASTASSVPTDIVFVFDTTGSMADEIAGVENSILSFSNTLQTSGLDVRLGAVTFGDAFDTVDSPTSIPGGVALGSPSAPPSFDPDERPTLPLTSNFDAFRSFIGANSARNGGDDPENGLGAVEFAYNSMAWRPGAARVLIVITDVYQHQAGSDTLGDIPASSRWAPKTVPVLLNTLKGKATVHVIGPVLSSSYGYVDMKDLTGVSGTGGVFTDLATGLTSSALGGTGVKSLDLDLTKLPIQNVLANSYTLKYRGSKTGGSHSLRIRVESGTIKGETSVTATY